MESVLLLPDNPVLGQNIPSHPSRASRLVYMVWDDEWVRGARGDLKPAWPTPLGTAASEPLVALRSGFPCWVHPQWNQDKHRLFCSCVSATEQQVWGSSPGVVKRGQTSLLSHTSVSPGSSPASSSSSVHLPLCPPAPALLPASALPGWNKLTKSH